MKYKFLFRRSKLLLGKMKEDSVELQKWADGIWRLIDEEQGNKALMNKDVFELIFHYKYCRLSGKKIIRLDFDRGEAEYLLREGWGVVDDRFNEYKYDSYRDQFVSLKGLLYDSLPEFRRYIINMFQEQEKVVINTASLVEDTFKKETPKEEDKEIKKEKQKKQVYVRQSKSKSKSAWDWQNYFAMGATVAAALGTITLSVWQLWNNNKSHR